MTPYLHIIRAHSGNLRASLYIDCDFCGRPKGPASALVTRDGLIIHQHDIDRIFTEETAGRYCEALLEQHK
jgi:hypothetical protein